MRQPMTVQPDEAIYNDNTDNTETVLEDTSVMDGVSFNYGSTTKLGRLRDTLKGL